MDVEDDEKAPSRPRRPAIMSDVGRLAGVSHQTVSRVINGSRHVSPQTRERVLAAMRELGYRPNSIARALATGRTRTLGVVSFDTTLYGPASTLFGIERAAHEAGYFIMVASLKALDRASVVEAIERLRVQGVDGILVIVSEEESAEALLHAPLDVPLVAVEAGPGPRNPRGGGRSGRGGDAGHAPSARPRARDRPPHHRAARARSSPSSAPAAGGPRSRPPARRRPSRSIGDWSAARRLPPGPPADAGTAR